MGRGGGVLRAQRRKQTASQAETDLHELILEGQFGWIGLFERGLELVEQVGDGIQTRIRITRGRTRAGSGRARWSWLIHVAGRLGGSWVAGPRFQRPGSGRSCAGDNVCRDEGNVGRGPGRSKRMSQRMMDGKATPR